MQPCLILILALIVTGCQPALRSSFDQQQKFYASIKNSSLAADQALRSAHYFKIAGRRDLALRELSAASAQDPNNPRLLNALGACYDDLGDYPTAQQIYSKTLSLDPDNVAALNNLGYSYYLAGNLEQAETSLQSSLAKDPKNLRARNNLGLVLCRQGKNDQAVRIWKQQEGEAQAREKLARVLAGLGKPLPADMAKPNSVTEIALSQSPGTSDKAKPSTSEIPVRGQAETLAEKTGSQANMAYRSTSKPEVSGLYAENKISPERSTRKSSPEDMSEPAALATLPSVKPSDHSRSKFIAVGAEPDKRLLIPDGGQSFPGTIENCQLLTLSSEQPPRRKSVNKIALPDSIPAELCNVEIRNGIGLKNLAKSLRRLFNQNGYNVPIVGNHVDFGAPETVIYFRGDQEKAAQVINDNLLNARLEKKPNLRPGIDVKILLGHDLFQNNQNLAPLQATRSKRRLPDLAHNP